MSDIATDLATESAASTPEKPFWLPRWSRTIFFFTVALAVAGIFLAFRIPISVFPQTNFPRVVIGVDNGVMPVEQMEVTITRPIEDAVNSVPGLATVRSITSRGSAEVDLFFSWNVDMFRTLQLVDAAVARVQQTLPATAQITTNKLTFASFPILGYALTSQTVSQTRLWEVANYELKPPLNRLPGVSTVVVQGGQVPEYHVIPNTAKLIAASLTVTDLVNAIQQTNLVQSPGLYQGNHELILALVGDQAHNLEQLSQISVKATAGGVPIHLRDVAQVVPATEPVYTIVTSNGQPAVLLNISRQPDSNTVMVANEADAEVARLRANLPPGVTIQPFYDQSHLVRDSIASVRDAILIGLLLAAIILVLFLRDWTSSLVAGLVIPVTILVTFIVLWAVGQSFNLMTLGGLAAAVGLVIDDAIVVVENIVLHRESGEKPGRSGTQSAARDNPAADRIDDHTHRCFPAADFSHRRYWYILPGAGADHDRGPADIAGTGADVDAGAESGPAARKQSAQGCGRRCRVGPSSRADGSGAALSRTGAARRACAAAGAGGSLCAAYRSGVLCLQGTGLGPAAGDGRRRICAGLHHARGEFPRGNQSRAAACGPHPAPAPRGHGHVAAHRAADGAGCGHRSQYR